MSVTFKLRRDATFHDGTPVTAHDVKWSLDRAVTSAASRPSRCAGSMEKPEQFVVVDDHTFRIDFLQKDKLTLPDLAIVVPAIFNSKLAQRHATDRTLGDKWMRANAAGGGAYKLEIIPGQEAAYCEMTNGKTGPCPRSSRVILREVPDAGNRRALVEHGDVDPRSCRPRTRGDRKKSGAYRDVGTPVKNWLQYVGLRHQDEAIR